MDALKVTPNPYEGFHLPNRACTAYFEFVLGIVPFANANCTVCQHPLCASGEHAVGGCAKGRDRMRRHDAVRNTIYERCRKAGLNARREDYIPGNRGNHRPGDVVVERFSEGRAAYMDVMITSTLRADILAQAAVEKGAAAARGEQEKKVKYRGRFFSSPQDLQERVFIPMVAETYGGWGSEAVEAFETIVAAEANVTHQKLGTVRRRLYGELAVLIAKHNAWAILDRRPRALEQPFSD